MKNFSLKNCFMAVCNCHTKSPSQLIIAIPKDFSSFDNLNNFHNTLYNKSDKYPSMEINTYIHIKFDDMKCFVNKISNGWVISCSSKNIEISLFKDSTNFKFPGFVGSVKDPNAITAIQKLFETGVQNFM